MLFVSIYFTSLVSAETARGDLERQLKTAGGLSWGREAPAGSNSMTGIVATMIQVFLGLLGIIFLILIIYGGYEWMTAQGDEEKVTKAKDTLQRAIIGLIIIIVAYSITFFVFSSLPGGGDGTKTIEY